MTKKNSEYAFQKAVDEFYDGIRDQNLSVAAFLNGKFLNG